MRTALLLILAVLPAAAQNPLVQLRNTSRPFSSDFQIGDRFEILITAAPNQPVSVRTTRQARIDWSPAIGSTDAMGRWSTAGQFEKSDFGGWSEIWTVGGKLAIPAVQFSVAAPCLPGGQFFVHMSGSNQMFICDTAEGSRSFVTPSLADPIRTPDGRLVPGRPTEETARQYHTQILQDLITSGKKMGPNPIALQSSQGGLGDETADLITTLIGVNALSDDETRNVLTILRAAFERPETIQPSAKEPSRTVTLLRHLADVTSAADLQREIAETIAYIQAR
jgi:hypothetical protein